MTASLLSPAITPGIATGLSDRDPRWDWVRQYLLHTDVGPLRTMTVEHTAPGTPQLLVHGLGMSSVSWIDVLPLLASRGPVAAIDLPGFGGSEPDAGVRSDLATMTAAIDAARRALGWDRMEVHGNSLGGLIAARHAVAHAATVDSLVLSAPTFSPGPSGITGLTRASIIGIGPLVVPGFGDAAAAAAGRSSAPLPGADRIAGAVFADPGALRPSLRQLFAEESAGLATHAWRADGLTTAAQALLREMLAWWRTDRLASQVEVPTLVISGATDRLLPSTIVPRLQRVRPDWDYRSMPSAGHAPFVDQPAAYARLVGDLAGVRP